MGIKKMLLLASMALAVLAVAGPASASASVLHDHEPIEETVEIHSEGVLGFNSGSLGGIDCNITTVVHAEPESTTGTVTAFEVPGSTHEECEGTSLLAGCTVESVQAIGLPWVTHIEANDTLVVTEGVVTGENSGCFATHVELEFPQATLTPDDSTTISTMTLSGTGTVSINEGFPLSATASGHQIPTELETWGLEG